MFYQYMVFYASPPMVLAVIFWIIIYRKKCRISANDFGDNCNLGLMIFGNQLLSMLAVIWFLIVFFYAQLALSFVEQIDPIADIIKSTK